jgi:hypothetical protein
MIAERPNARLVEAFADGEQRLEVAEQLEAVTV